MTITLLDGTIVDTGDVRFDPVTYHFYWDSGAGGIIDVTNTMTRVEKQDNFPQFDPIKDDYRLSNERIAAKGGTITYQTATGPVTIPASQAPIGEVGSTSLWENFTAGVKSDLPKVGIGIGAGIGIVAIVALVLFVGARK